MIQDLKYIYRDYWVDENNEHHPIKPPERILMMLENGQWKDVEE